MTREDYERTIENIRPYYPWKHEVDYLCEHDAAQRRVIEDYRNTIIKVGIKLGLIMPERERYFKDDAVKEIEQQAQEIGRLKTALKDFKDAFECDFVLEDGTIVDRPDERWSPLVNLYHKSKAALAATGEEGTVNEHGAE